MLVFALYFYISDRPHWYLLVTIPWPLLSELVLRVQTGWTLRVVTNEKE